MVHHYILRISQYIKSVAQYFEMVAQFVTPIAKYIDFHLYGITGVHTSIQGYMFYLEAV